MRILLRGQFDRYSGYGNDAVDIARHLDKAGVDVVPWPYSIVTGLPEDFVNLLTKRPTKGAGAYDATLQFLPPFGIRITDAARKPNIREMGLPLHIAPVHYGWSMWEKDRLTRDDMRGHGIGQSPWRLLTAMYGYTEVSVQAFRHYAPKVAYRHLPGGIDPDLYPVIPRPVGGPTRFVMVGELHQRKDPFVAIDAFRELKAEKGDDFDAELHLKTTIPGLHPQIEQWAPGVHVIHDYWPYDQLIEWMGTMTCYVGPSRGEGNLKPPMEFMATGGPVIATYWSGPENWLTPEVGYPLDYQLAHMVPSDPDSPREARADKDHLKQLMWHVHSSRREASEKGRAAAEWIREVADWAKIIGRLLGDLERDLAAA